MEYMARVELGMSSEDFYSCTWYDWCLWVERINALRRQRTEDHDLLMQMFRQSLAYYFNWNRGKGSKISPQDFWPLSFEERNDDTEPTEEEKKELQETIKRLEAKSKFKKRG